MWAIALVALAGSVLVLPTDDAEAQSNYIYAEPGLLDKQGSYTWFTPPADIARLGYGSNGFVFTLAAGNDSDSQVDNVAVWQFDIDSGRYRVEAYIPSQWATAHPQYLMWADADGNGSHSSGEYVAGVWLDQAPASGWTSLGEHQFNGDVRIEVRDVRSRDDWRDVGTVNARLAADAIRLVPVAQVFPPGRVDAATVDYIVTNSAVGTGKIVWQAVADATSYDVEAKFTWEQVGTDVVEEQQVYESGVACCEFEPLSLSFIRGDWRIIAYSRKVRGVNSAGTGLWSIELLGTVAYDSVPVPGAVSNVRYDRDQGRIVWQPADHATGYHIEWTQPGEDLQRSSALCTASDGTASGELCVFPLNRILHKELTFRISGHNSSDNRAQFGPWSSWVSDPAERAAPEPPPGVVTGLRFENDRIHWDPLASAAAYQIEWRNEGEASTRQRSDCSDDCSLGITRLPDRELHFRVRAQNEGGTGPWSSWATASAEISAPSAVPDVRYSAGRIRWGAATGAEAYDIEWRDVGGSVHRESIVCTDACSLAVDRDFAKALRFRVRGKNTAGRGPWSSWLEEAADAVRAQVVGVGHRQSRHGPELYWKAVPTVTDYEIDAREVGGDRATYRSGIKCTGANCSYLYRDDSTTSSAFKAATAFRVRTADGTRRGPWSVWIDVPKTESPSAVRNLQAVRHKSDQLKVTWQRPLSTGDKPIDYYEVQYSRSGWQSRVYKIGGFVDYSPPLKAGSYTVRVRAVNRAGQRGSAASVDAAFELATPGLVRNLRYSYVDRGKARHCDGPGALFVHGSIPIRWDAPTGSTYVSSYDIKIVERRFKETSERQRHTRTVSYEDVTSPFWVCPWYDGAAYQISVTAKNSMGEGPEKAIRVTSPPSVFVGREGRVLWDDPDAIVSWHAIPDATKYDIDWRYLKFDSARMRNALNKLKKGTLSRDERKRLENPEQFLVPVHNKIGSSATKANNGHEMTCSARIDKKKCTNHVMETSVAFEPLPQCNWTHWTFGGKCLVDQNLLRVKVDDVGSNLLFQARVRAHGPGGAGPWSTWETWSDSVTPLVCAAFDIYEQIQDIQLAVKAVDVILTVASAAAAASSGGTSTLTGAALKTALSKAAKVMIRKGIVKSVVKPVVRGLIVDYKNAVSIRIFRYLAGCITDALELKNSDSQHFWREMLDPEKLDLRKSTISNFLKAVWP